MRRILLVEDEVLIAMAERSQMEGLGYSVAHAISGKAAIAEAASADPPFDAILMDIDLGAGMDGTEAAAEILGARDVPIVFLSSHVEPEVVRKTESITSYGYVVKNSGMIILDASIKMAIRLFQEKAERKEAERQLTRLTSLYAALSQINLAIVRAVGVESLAGEVCRVAVQAGPFKLAWIGRHDAKAKKVIPIAYAGEPESIVLGIDHGSDPLDERPCLCGKAIRELSPHIVNDLARAADPLGWPAGILETGVRSAAVFPVRARGAAWGVFAVYSTEAGIFKDREIGLLEEAALEVGFAIEKLGDAARRAEAERLEALSTAVLQVLNEPSTLRETSAAILGLIKEGLGLDAVGIRLKDGDDFPYFSEAGFDKDFLVAENSLALHDETGMVCRDADGRVCLECSCGLVLLEKCGPPGDYVTEGGSLWTNDSVAALESLKGADPRTRPRDRCTHDGFKSVALIPIRVDGRIIGLLHLNDRRRDRFTPESIRSLEGLTASFGIAVERKRAEERLLAEEAHYRLIAENAADVIWVLDPIAGRFSYVSPSVRKLRGYAPEEVMAQPAKLALTEESFGAVSRSIAENLPAFLAQGGGTMSFVDEVDQPRKDGSVIHTEVTTTYLLNGEGKVEVVGVSRDITERKRAEDDLRRSEERFRLALSHAPVSVAIQDLDLRYTWAYNHRSRSPEEIVGKTDYDFFPAEADRLTAIKRRAIQTGESASERLWVSDGVKKAYLDLYIQPLRDDSGRIDSLGIATVDLTEWKDTGELLEASEAKFKAVFENAPVGISILDGDRNLLESNEALARIVRIGKDGLAAGAYRKRRYIREDGSQIPVEELASQRAIVERKAIRDVVNGIVMEDGGIVWTQVSAAPLGLPETRIVVITQDVTERKRAEAEAGRQLAEKETVLKEAYHRIKNNIASIEALLSLQAKSSGNDEVKAALQESIARVQSTRVLYERLLLSDDHGLVATGAYFRSLIDSLAAVYPDRGNVSIELSVADAAIYPRKMVMLGIIVNELITNVYKYAYKAGEGGRVSIALTEEGDWLKLVVKDDGAGLARDRGADGAGGFGLTLVGMLAEQLEGSFALESDGGTRAVLRFKP